MNSETNRPRSLREMELKVEAEGREWMRQRSQQKLQEQAERHGRVFPPHRTPTVARPQPHDASAQRRRCR